MKNFKIILTVLMVIACIAAGFFALNKTMFEAKSHYEGHEETLGKFIISEYSGDEAYVNLADECRDYLDKYKKALDRKDMISCPKLDKALTQKEESLVKYDKIVVSEMATKLKNFKNTKSLFGYETARIEAVESEAGDLVKSEDYNSAYNKYVDTLSSMEKIASSDIVDVLQYDFSEFPKVKLYIDSAKLEEILGHSIDGTKFKIVEKIGDSYEEIPVDDYGTTSEAGGLNVDLVADVSASMQSCFVDVKSATTSFVQNIDMTKNKVGLMSFSDYISRDSDFTNDQIAVENAINSLELQNMTCLYDALAVSLSDTNRQAGAKCIVAFTDGMDNMSYYNDYNGICSLAKSYGIPIYIIGIGALDFSWEQTLQNISSQTNGYYKNIDTFNIDEEMSAVYQDILKSQEQLYYISYLDKNEDESQKRELYIEYVDEDITVRNQLKDTVEKPSETVDENIKKAAVASFIRESNLKYFEALNTRNIAAVQDFYDNESQSGKDLLEDVQANIQNAEEKQATFEFYDYSIDKVEIASDGTYKVTYSQKYEKSSSEGSESTEASSTDTVIEKNGRFYIVGYKKNYKKDLSDTTNKLIDSNY